MALEKTLYIGPFIETPSLGELDICPNGMIGVDEQGKIAFVTRSVKGAQIPVEGGWEDAKVVRINGTGWFFPGFIGTYHRCHGFCITFHYHRRTAPGIKSFHS